VFARDENSPEEQVQIAGLVLENFEDFLEYKIGMN